jgi:hypothetical protein
MDHKTSVMNVRKDEKEIDDRLIQTLGWTAIARTQETREVSKMFYYHYFQQWKKSCLNGYVDWENQL